MCLAKLCLGWMKRNVLVWGGNRLRTHIGLIYKLCCELDHDAWNVRARNKPFADPTGQMQWLEAIHPQCIDVRVLLTLFSIQLRTQSLSPAHLTSACSDWWMEQYQNNAIKWRWGMMFNYLLITWDRASRSIHQHLQTQLKPLGLHSEHWNKELDLEYWQRICILCCGKELAFQAWGGKHSNSFAEFAFFNCQKSNNANREFNEKVT